MGTMRVISKFFDVKRVSVKKKVWFGFGAGCCAAFEGYRKAGLRSKEKVSLEVTFPKQARVLFFLLGFF